MLVLHGSWILDPEHRATRFALWGEVEPTPGQRRRPAPARAGSPVATARARRHSFAARHEQLWGVLAVDCDGVQIAAAPEAVRVRLPSTSAAPLPSPDLPLDGAAGGDQPPTLATWQVDALTFAPARAAEMLMELAGEACPADVVLGQDLRYWIAATRFALALLYRQRLIPVVRQEIGRYVARWVPLLDEPADAERFAALVAAMPPACRALADSASAPEPAPRALLQGVLTDLTDELARTALIPLNTSHQHMFRPSRGRRRMGEAWLEALCGTPAIEGESKALAAFYAQYRAWAEPAAPVASGEPFRLCLRLEPPTVADDEAGAILVPKSTARDWLLEYVLQATDDPSLLVPAGAVWRERGTTARFLQRRLDEPQERLLGWLGQASRLYPPIDTSLRSSAPEGALLTVGEAHEFVREKALLLRAAGFGVQVPGLDSRLGVHLRLGGGRSAPGKVTGPASFSQQSLVNFDWELALGDERLSRQEFETLARLKQPLVLIRGRWVELRPEQLEQALAFFKAHGEGGQMALTDALSLALAPDGEVGLPVVGVSSEGWVDEVLRGLRAGGGRVSLTEPPGFVGALRPYQRVGLSWLATLQAYGLGACLADDMGLGKTVQVIALLLQQRGGELTIAAPVREAVAAGGNGGPGPAAAAGKAARPAARRAKRNGASAAPSPGGAAPPSAAVGPALLVCPTSVLGNWQRELARFGPSLRVLVHHGAAREKAQFATLAPRHDVVLSTYALLHRDEAELAAVEWDAVILDEAQNVKNAATRAAQAARRLPARGRAALTGTPVENRLADLWSIFQFLNPGYLGTAEAFRKRFAAPIERGADAATATRLKSLVGPFILRRLKTDRAIIQDLPEKNEMKVYCTLTREQATLYEAVVKTSLDDIEGSEGIQRRGQVLAVLTKLKQLCDHPALFLHDASALAGRSGKLTRLTEMLEEVLAVDDRALVFTQYAEMGKLLKEHLEATYGREVLFLHGGTPASARDRLVARFQDEGRGGRVFVLSLKAGGTGLNLTRANHVFHFDRWWNPAVEDQATDRAFRIGQRRDVQVHKFVCAGTFEEAIDQLIERKVALAQRIVGTSEAWLTELGNDELRELLALRRDAVQED